MGLINLFLFTFLRVWLEGSGGTQEIEFGGSPFLLTLRTFAELKFGELLYESGSEFEFDVDYVDKSLLDDIK